MKSLTENGIQRLLSLIRNSINDRIHKDDEINNDTVLQLFNSNSGSLFGGFGNQGDAPIGTIISYMGTIVPDGYLACDGETYHIIEYPALAKHIEINFGSINHFGGDGETTFAVPDLSGRFILSNSDQYDIGDIGGEDIHRLTVDEMPKHQHISLFAKVVTPKYANVSNGNRVWDITPNYVTSPYEPFKSIETGNSMPHNNMPPYMTVLHCIKAVEDVIIQPQYIQKQEFPQIYSTDEVQIGTFNGKPYYRRMFVNNDPQVSTGGVSYKIDDSGLDIISTYGYMYGPTYRLNSSYMLASNNEFRVWYDTGLHAIRYTCGAAQSPRVMYFIIEYTKTTDELTIGLG